MDIFGDTSPELVPAHFFMSGTHVVLDYDDVQRADTDRQNYSVAPRNWYIAAKIECLACRETFLFSVDEQKLWYEEYGFYVDSFPNRCKACRAERRELKRLRQEHDANIQKALRTDGPDSAIKQRLVVIIDRLVEAGVATPRMLKSREVLVSQIRRSSHPPAGPSDSQKNL